MNVVEILKQVIEESLQLKGLTDVELAKINSISPLTIKLSNQKILPVEFLEFIPKTMYLRSTTDESVVNTKIMVIKKLGGQQYIILDNLDDTTIGNTISSVNSVSPLKITLANGKILEDDKLMIFTKGLMFLRNTADKENIGKKLLTCRETGTGKYIFYEEIEE